MDKNDIIEYVMNTPHNTNRAVLSSMLNQLTKGGDDSGSSWTVLTEESVTTEAGVPSPSKRLAYNKAIDSETLRVTFNGDIYECTRSDAGELWVYGGIGPDGPDFSEYPFAIVSVKAGDTVTLYTETAGTYTVKIEAPQSGGSSDFSTAQVTVVDDIKRNILLPFIVDDDGQELHSIMNLGISESGSYTVPLYKGSLTGLINEGSGSVSVSGDITHLPNGIVVITGDGTITITIS